VKSSALARIRAPEAHALAFAIFAGSRNSTPATSSARFDLLSNDSFGAEIALTKFLMVLANTTDCVAIIITLWALDWEIGMKAR
jgi:hypothetical protein